MRAQIYFSNLKRAITGTTVGGKYGMDVNVIATSTGVTVLETRFHDTSVTQINQTGGAFVEIETAAALANTISRIQISATFGEPLVIRKAANAGAAAAAPDLFVLNQGQALSDIPVSLVAGDKLWVKSLSANDVTSGYLMLNLIG